MTREQIQRLALTPDARSIIINWPGPLRLALAAIRLIPGVPEHFDGDDWNALRRAVLAREPNNTNERITP